MIHYQIDTTEGGYVSLEGEVENITELKELLTAEGQFADCVGYLRTDVLSKASLCIAALKEHGVFLGCAKDGEEYLSLGHAELLEEEADVWGDGLYVSVGLFITEELAWQGIRAFIECGNLYEGIRWITSDQIPENGYYII